jgi:predicted Rossmann fold nucleotide-binding protein DprA/Smf involved in DNA uptake
MNIKNLLILSQIKGIGPAFFKNNRRALLCTDDIYQFVGESDLESLDLLPRYEQNASAILDDCKALGISVVSSLSDEYPKQLLDISDPPVVLYMKGNVNLLSQVVAIIGTRHSSPLGNAIAERLGEYFSGDFAICNGLVEGIDEHSVYHNNQITDKAIGIISGGLNYKQTCSKAHVKIIDDVLQAGGLVISEYPPQQPEDKYSGSKASRIQAGLSNGLILVESSLDGGSKYTIAKFAKLDRPLGVIHYPASSEYSGDNFKANRTIVSEGTRGIAQMIGLKSDKTIRVRDIVSIQGKDDYEIFKRAVLDAGRKETDLFGCKCRR